MCPYSRAGPGPIGTARGTRRRPGRRLCATRRRASAAEAEYQHPSITSEKPTGKPRLFSASADGAQCATKLAGASGAGKPRLARAGWGFQVWLGLPGLAGASRSGWGLQGGLGLPGLAGALTSADASLGLPRISGKRVGPYCKRQGPAGPPSLTRQAREGERRWGPAVGCPGGSLCALRIEACAPV